MAPLNPALVRRFRPVRRQLAAVVVLGVCGAAALVVQAGATAAVVVAVVDKTPVIGLAATVLAALLVRAGVRWATASISAMAAAEVKAALRKDLLAVVLDPRRWGDARDSTTRRETLLGPGLDRIDGYVARFIPQLVLGVLIPGIVVVALLVLDLWSGLIVALTLPLVVVFGALIGLKTQDEVDRRWAEMARLGRHFTDVLSGMTVLRTFGRDQEKGLREAGRRHRKATVSALKIAFVSSLALDLVATLSVALVAVSVGLRLVGGSLDLRTGLMVLLLAPEAYLPLRQLAASFHDSTEGLAVLDEALDLCEPASTQAHREPAPNAPIELRAVTVEYSGRDLPALDAASARIEPGEFVAITGPSGSGKSTLLSILLGLATPTSGRVLVGPYDLHELDPEAWRRQIAWVPQFPAIISGSIADNVRLGAPHACDDQVERALSRASASDLAPERRVNEGGTDLSAGERRRIGIARALLRVETGDVGLVLMDEPTAGLDADREAEVLAGLTELSATVLVVAHRPETIRAADRILDLGARV